MGYLKKIIIFFTFVQFVSCGNKTEFKEEIPTFTSIRIPLSELSFEKVNTALFQSSCVQCHPGYSDYDTVFNEREKILNAVIENRMPKNAPAASDAQKSLLQAWVRAGAPFGQGDNRPDPIVLEPSWESLSKLVFFPKCVQCHNPNGQASFMDLSDRQKFFEQREYLLNNFENVEESYLIEILRDPQEPMPPEWSDIERLSEKEVEVIIDWIQQGLP